MEATRERFQRVREACRRQGRDPNTLTYSNALVVCCGRDEADVARRAASTRTTLALPESAWLKGTPNQLVDIIGQFAAAGADQMYLQFLNLDDLDQIELIAAKILPQIA